MISGLYKHTRSFRAASLAVAALLLAASSVCSARPVKIATYNVENLFDRYDDPYAGDIDRFANNKLLVKKESDVEAVAQVIRSVNADVVGLQEVENRGTLEDLNSRYLKDMGYKEVVLVEGNDSRGIDVALLSRFPLGPVVSYRHLDLQTPGLTKQARFSRDLLEVTVRPPGGAPFTVFVTHSKSRSGGKSADLQRLAEARKIRDIWDTRLKSNPNAKFVLCADLNDDPSAVTIKVLQGGGKTAVKAVPAKAPDGSTWTEDSSFPDKFDPITFDYLMASPAIMRSVTRGGIYRPAKGSAHYNTMRQASDHCPVWAEFDL